MKVNVANYLIGDLSNRFPISSRNPIDNDLIDVMVDKWSKRQYSGTDINISFCDGQNRRKTLSYVNLKKRRLLSS